MDNLLSSIGEMLLMGPGPSCCYPEVYRAMGLPTLGYLDPTFTAIMDAIQAQLQTLMRTKNLWTFPISGTGSAGMETSFANLIEPGDTALILVNGVFSGRMVEVATRFGAHVDEVEFPWGKPIEIGKVKDALSVKKYKLVAAVHAETSTGVRNPIEDLGKLLKSTETLFLVDAVTSLGGIDLQVDSWGIDVVYSGSQKCISCPPGLSPMSFSQKAIDVISRRKNKVPNFYFDAALLAQYWQNEKPRVYHHTPPINLLYGFHQALSLILTEGMEQVQQRHRNNHLLLKKGIEAKGLQMFVDPPYQLPMLNTVLIPPNVDDATVRRILRTNHKIEIGGGMGSLAGKIWRIGLMGHTSRSENVERFLKAMDLTLHEVK